MAALVVVVTGPVAHAEPAPAPLAPSVNAAPPQAAPAAAAPALKPMAPVAAPAAADALAPAACPPAAEPPPYISPPPPETVVVPEPPEGDTHALDGAADEEAEDHDAPSEPSPGGPRYTSDLCDADLQRLWKESPQELGSISVGFTDAGRLVNGAPFPAGKNWTIVDPPNCWATTETIDYLTAAINHVCEEFPDTPPLRVNHIGRKEGGWLRPHKSHQSGRDADLAFYYRPGAEVKKGRGREGIMDLPRNWALIRALATMADVQMILVDRSIQKVLYDYARSIGEDKAWLDSLFRAGKSSLLQHARRHRDHFHVRFFNPRAQELGRRVQPLLSQGRDDNNVVIHRVKRGDTIGGLARKYGASAVAIRRENGLRSNALRTGRTLAIPIKGPCTHCPVPPAVVVPPRRLPPTPAVATIPEPAAL